MRKTKHTESREDRELSVQELETVTGGMTEQAAKEQENKEQMEAIKVFAQALQSVGRI